MSNSLQSPSAPTFVPSYINPPDLLNSIKHFQEHPPDWDQVMANVMAYASCGEHDTVRVLLEVAKEIRLMSLQRDGQFEALREMMKEATHVET